VRTLHNAADRSALLLRIDRLGPETSPRWGRMNVGQMVCHLKETMRMTVGDLPTVPKGKAFYRSALVKYLILRVFPFPKGAPTAPELVIADARELASEKARLLELIERMGQSPTSGPGPEHPTFGPLSQKEWGEMAHKHIDHHLRQFGV
jgi:hypothetical protein